MSHASKMAAAAAVLATAIADARADGYRVPFPDHALAGISVSETSRVAQPAPQAQPEPPVLGKPTKPAA